MRNVNKFHYIQMGTTRVISPQTRIIHLQMAVVWGVKWCNVWHLLCLCIFIDFACHRTKVEHWWFEVNSGVFTHWSAFGVDDQGEESTRNFDVQSLLKGLIDWEFLLATRPVRNADICLTIEYIQQTSKQFIQISSCEMKIQKHWLDSIELSVVSGSFYPSRVHLIYSTSRPTKRVNSNKSI